MLDAHPHQKTIFKKNGFKIHFTCFPVIKTAHKQLFLYDSLFLIPVALRVFECVHKMTQSFPPFLLLMLSSLLSVPGFFSLFSLTLHFLPFKSCLSPLPLHLSHNLTQSHTSPPASASHTHYGTVHITVHTQHRLIFPFTITAPPPLALTLPHLSFPYSVSRIVAQITEALRRAVVVICHCVKRAKLSQRKDLLQRRVYLGLFFCFPSLFFIFNPTICD